MKRFVIILCLVVTAGWIGWHIYKKVRLTLEGPQKNQRGPVAVAVEVKPVITGSIQDIREFTGSLQALSQFIVAPKISGRLKKLYFNIGDRVRQGDPVALLDDEEYHQEVDQALAELEVARANLKESQDTLEITKREYERTVVLRQKKIASESELDTVEARYKSQESKLKVAQAQVVQKEAALKVAEVRLSYTRIKVPPNRENGFQVVGERYVHEGAMLAANNPIVSIFDIQSVIAAIHVIEEDYSKIRLGLDADVLTDAYPGRSFSGKVVRMAPLLKETSRQARVEIEIPNFEGLLKPGMFIRAHIQFRHNDHATIIPRDALVKRVETTGVFQVDTAKKVVDFVPVRTGIMSGQQVEILSPPLSGYVVTLGHHLLEDGTPVILPEGSLTDTGKEKEPMPLGSKTGKDKAGLPGGSPS